MTTFCNFPQCNCPIDKTTICARGLPDPDRRSKAMRRPTSIEKGAHKSLLRPGEQIDYSEFPWPVPKKGDALRARMLFDTDPASKGGESLRRATGNCVVWAVTDSVSRPDKLVYYYDSEGLIKPEILSVYEHSGESSNWGGVSYWGDMRIPLDAIPLTAIKAGILTGFAQKLARRAEAQDRGIYA